jgi:hypothetical protein
MQLYALLAPMMGWIWYIYSKEFDKIPLFANIKIKSGSLAEKILSIFTIVIIIILPVYLQSHFIVEFNTRGHVYIYPMQFGYTPEELDKNGGGCIYRNIPLCVHPQAGRYSLVPPRAPATGGYWDNAYQYGGPSGTATFFPILQPFVIFGLTLLALYFNIKNIFSVIRSLKSGL